MDLFSQIGAWISDNETLLSGIAALVAVVGVVVSPAVIMYRRWRNAAGGDPAAAGLPERITIRDLSVHSGPPTRFAEVDGLHIAYNERGEGPIDMIWVPGIIAHLTVTNNIPPLRDTYEALAGFSHLVCFDKRGQGLSDPTISAPTLDERVHDILAVMDAAELESAFLFGISEGGPVCLKFASEHPERTKGVILFSSGARFLQSDDYPIGLTQHDLEATPRYWGKGKLRDVIWPSLSRAQMDDETYRAMERLVGSRTSMQQLLDMMLKTDVRPLLPDLQIPTLVLHFTGDIAMPIRLGRYVAEQLPNARFLELSGSDHGDLSQSPEAVAAVEQFCTEVLEGRFVPDR